MPAANPPGAGPPLPDPPAPPEPPAPLEPPGVVPGPEPEAPECEVAQEVINATTANRTNVVTRLKKALRDILENSSSAPGGSRLLRSNSWMRCLRREVVGIG